MIGASFGKDGIRPMVGVEIGKGGHNIAPLPTPVEGQAKFRVRSPRDGSEWLVPVNQIGAAFKADPDLKILGINF
jgi:hypothetical protein